MIKMADADVKVQNENSDNMEGPLNSFQTELKDRKDIPVKITHGRPKKIANWKRFQFAGRKPCCIVAGSFIALGLVRVITCIIFLGIVHQNKGKCKSYMTCYLLAMDPPLPNFKCGSLALCGALLSAWMFELLPGVILLTGAIQMKSCFYGPFNALMAPSLGISTFQLLSAIIFSFIWRYRHIAIYPTTVIICFRTYVFWCGYMLKKETDRMKFKSNPNDLQCQLVSISFPDL